MAKASYVFSQVRALLDDQEADFATDDYLVPFLQSAQDDFTVEVLNHANLGRMKFPVTLPAVAAGSQSLASYFGDGQPLQLLEQVIAMREKPTAYSEALYSWMQEVLVPTYAYGTTQPLNRVYTFTGQDILLPGANQALDINVYGSFKPQAIQNGESPLVLGTETILKYGCAAAVCLSRGAGATAKRYSELKYSTQNALFNNWIMQQQNIRVRALPFRRRTWPLDTYDFGSN